MPGEGVEPHAREATADFKSSRADCPGLGSTSTSCKADDSTSVLPSAVSAEFGTSCGPEVAPNYDRDSRVAQRAIHVTVQAGERARTIEGHQTQQGQLTSASMSAAAASSAPATSARPAYASRSACTQRRAISR